MEKSTTCKNVFKEDRGASRDQLRETITQIWIQMINQIERSSMTLAGLK